MPDEDYEAEGFAFLYEHPELLPDRCPLDVSWAGFQRWRAPGGGKYVVRLALEEVYQ